MDFWTISGDCICRHHVAPLQSHSHPTRIRIPKFLKLKDVKWLLSMPCTTTGMSMAQFLSDEWEGRTCCPVLRPPLQASYKWVNGQVTNIRDTKEDFIQSPEVWLRSSKKQKQQEMDRWDHQEPLLQGARRERGNFQAHHEDERWKSVPPQRQPCLACVRTMSSL